MRMPRVLPAVVTSGALLALVTACSTPPGPEDQRTDLLTVAEHVETELVELFDLADLRVVDEGAEPVPCPAGGERYRRLTIGTMDLADHVEGDGSGDPVDGRLDFAESAVDGAVATSPVAGYFGRSRSRFTDEPQPRPAMYFSEEGPGRGAWLTADLVPFEDGSVLVRLEASTTCG